MADRKKKVLVKHKKTNVKKHKSHNVTKKKDIAVEQPSVSTSETTAPAEPLAGSDVASQDKPSETSPIAGPSEVAEIDKKEPESNLESQWSGASQSQPQPQSPDSQEQKPQQEPSQNIPDTQTPQAESASITPPAGSTAEPPANEDEPVGKITQDPLAPSGVVRDKDEAEIGGESIDEPKKSKLWIIIAIIVIILVLVGGALWYFRENVLKRFSVGVKPTPTQTVVKNTPTPATDSAKMEIDLSEYSIRVLNGSGISGIAGETKDILEAEDFNVEEIGNADSSDYEGTVIKAKGHVPSEFLEKLKEALEETYILDASEDLEDSEDFDVIVIIGSSKQL